MSDCGKPGGVCWCRVRGWVGRCPYRPSSYMVRMGAPAELESRPEEKGYATLLRGAGLTQEDIR